MGTQAWAFRSRWRLVIGLLSATILTNLVHCGGAEVVHVEVDPTFDYSQAASAEIGIVGFAVTAVEEERGATLRRQLPPLLAQSIQRTRPDLKIISPDRIRQTVGDENQQAILDRYAVGGQLDDGSMAALFSSTRGLVRYMVLGRVEKDEITRFELVEEDSVSSGTRYKVRREMAIFMEVYDLEVGQSVFRELITNDLTSSRYQPDVTTGDADSFKEACGNMIVSCLGSIVVGVFQGKSEEDGYPAPPGIDETTRDMFEKFAESLPAPKSN
jgi:hypothetical protein